jgi:hypothetical protein
MPSLNVNANYFPFDVTRKFTNIPVGSVFTAVSQINPSVIVTGDIEYSYTNDTTTGKDENTATCITFRCNGNGTISIVTSGGNE